MKDKLYRFIEAFALVFGLITLSLATSGQLPEMLFSYTSNEIKLSSDLATCIAQDSSGAIWIGTNEGLNSYDGYQTKQYLFDQKNNRSITHNTISKLFVANNGDLWVATQMGICVYDKSYDDFKRIVSNEDSAGVRSLYITSINQDLEGNVYASAGNTLYRFNHNSKKFDSIFQTNTGVILDFIFDNNGNLWLGASEDGLIYHDFKKGTTTNYRFEEGNPNSLGNNEVRSLSLLNDSLWIATYGGGINLLDLKSERIKRYSPPDEYARFTFYTYFDRDQNLWTCDLTGLKFYDRANDFFYGYYAVKSNEYSIKNGVRAIIQDRQGNYWTIHSPGSVGVRIVPKGFSIINNQPGKLWRTSDNNIKAIEFDLKGNCWIGNGFNGIDIFDYKKGIVTTYHYNAADRFSLGQGGIGCIFRDSKGKMWVGSNLGGLQYFDEQTGRFYSYINNPGNPNSIANNDIRSVAEDKNGNLWVVTHGKGIDRFNTEKNIFYHYTNASHNLSNDWVFQVVFDQDENLWAATPWGLSRLQKGSDRFENFFFNASDSATISSNVVNCLFVDKLNRLWVGTSGGLNLFNSESKKFLRIKKGYTSNNISAILEGGSYIWVSSVKGLSRVDPTTYEVLDFDENDGLIKDGYHSRSAVKSGDMLFFGGNEGITTFYPEQIKFNTEVPKILLTGISINNEPVNTFGLNSALQKHISQTKVINLASDQNTIGIEFISNNLIDPHKNQFKYKLDGVDKKWIDAGANNRAIYSHLNPGKYKFRVIGSNNDGVWNETGASLQINISPPWWSTWLFRICVVLAGIGLVVFYFYWKTASLRRQSKLLEQKVEERTKDLNGKNELLEEQKAELSNMNTLLVKRQETIETQSEELKQQAEELKVVAENLEETNKNLVQSNATKDKLFSIIAHDLKNPFNVILGYTDLMAENFEAWDKSEQLQAINFIRDASTRTYSLLENLLNWSRSQSRTLDFSPKVIQANDILNAVLRDVESYALKKRIKIENQTANKDHSIFADRDMLSLVFRNLLMNAIKFSKPGSRIFIDVSNDASGISLFKISDEGVGMDAVKAKSLFDPEKNISTSGTEGEKGTGLGLLLCHEFITIHGGEISVESQPGKGATFFFSLPPSEGV